MQDETPTTHSVLNSFQVRFDTEDTEFGTQSPQRKPLSTILLSCCPPVTCGLLRRVGPGNFAPGPQRSVLDGLPSDGSCHPRKLPPSKPAGSSCRQLTHYGSSVYDLPPSLRGRRFITTSPQFDAAP